MIRYALRLAFVLMLVAAAASQASAQAYLRAGITAGVNLANASLEPDFPTVEPGSTRGMRPGPLIGATLEYGVRDFPIAWQPEFQYLEKGVKVTYAQPAPGVDSTLDVRYRYIEFPVLVRIPFMEGSTRAYAVIGPNIGLNLSARSLYESTRDSAKTSDIFGITNRTDIGIDIGAGVEFEVASGMYILVDARYTHGLTDVTDLEGAEEQTWYSRDIKLKAGLKWDLWTARSR